MFVELSSGVLRLLNSVETTKVLGLYAPDGTLELVPLTIVKASTPDLILLPQTTDNITRDLLMQIMEESNVVSILCLEQQRGEKRAFQLTCVVREYQTAGPLYEKFMDELRVSYSGLKGVWVLQPLRIKERY